MERRRETCECTAYSLSWLTYSHSLFIQRIVPHVPGPFACTGALYASQRHPNLALGIQLTHLRSGRPGPECQLHRLDGKPPY
ncbi:hypothetical protein CGRA01v4_07090 [Colletotrichum graminicola]|nr:hypothetical protein CGRA01v4_07090 [Colletotrichum graminicola]